MIEHTVRSDEHIAELIAKLTKHTVRSEEYTAELIAKLTKDSLRRAEIEFQYDKETVPIKGYEVPEQFRDSGIPTHVVGVIHELLSGYKGIEPRLIYSRVKKQILSSNFDSRGYSKEMVRDIINTAKHLSEEDFTALVEFSRLKGAGRIGERKCLEFRLIYPQIRDSEIYARMVFPGGRSFLKDAFVDLSDCRIENIAGDNVIDEIRLRIRSPMAYTIKILNTRGVGAIIYNRKKEVLNFSLGSSLQQADALEIEYDSYQEYPPPSDKRDNWDPEYVAQIISAAPPSQNEDA